MAEKLEMKTASISQENIKKIGELFPNCVTETNVRGGGDSFSYRF